MSNKSAPKQKFIDMRPDPGYWVDFGRFMEQYASTETALFYFYCHTAQIPNRSGRVVFAGVRTDQMIKHIRLLWDVAPPSPKVKTELQDVLTRLGSINAVRNSLVHYASFNSEEGRISTDIARAKLPESAKAYRVDAELVRQMTHDSTKIGQHLMSIFVHPTLSLAERKREGWPFLSNAWQYKHNPKQRRKSPRQTPDRATARDPKPDDQPPTS